MMNDNFIRNMAMSLISGNPRFKNDPTAKELIDILSSGDNARGEELANRILSERGITKDEALRQAQNFFNLK